MSTTFSHTFMINLKCLWRVRVEVQVSMREFHIFIYIYIYFFFERISTYDVRDDSSLSSDQDTNQFLV